MIYTKVFLIYTIIGIANPVVIDMDRLSIVTTARLSMCEQMAKALVQIVQPRTLRWTCVEIAE